MAKVGVFVNLNERVADPVTVERVRRKVLKRFDADPSNRVDVYRMVPLRPHETITADDTVAVVIPHSRLDADTIEDLVQTNRAQQEALIDLKLENANLKQRLEQSDNIRLEALETVTKLQSEFMSLLNDIVPKTPVVAATARSPGVSKYSRDVKLSQRKHVPRLGLSNLRH